jgi:hypothetical protein
MQPVGVIGTIGDHLGCWQAFDEFASRRHVVLLAGSDFEADREAKRVYDGM